MRWFITLVCLLMAAPATGEEAGRALPPILSDPGFKQLLISCDWKGIGEHLDGREDAFGTAPGRILAAHIALAHGECDLASRLVLVDIDEESLSDWRDWCADLAAGHPSAACPAYLLGDAHARASDFAAALPALDKAVAQDPEFVLALNARGVVRMLSGDRDGAFEDWHGAIALDPDFADPYANIAVAYIEGGGTSTAARKELDKALAREPEFALARNSQACISALLADFDLAADQLESAGAAFVEGNPYVDYNREQLNVVLGRADGEVSDTGESARGFEMHVGAKFDIPGLNNLVSADIGFSWSEQAGGVYLIPSAVDVAAGGKPARFGTNYLLCYPREWVKGRIQE